MKPGLVWLFFIKNIRTGNLSRRGKFLSAYAPSRQRLNLGRVCKLTFISTTWLIWSPTRLDTGCSIGCRATPTGYFALVTVRFLRAAEKSNPSEKSCPSNYHYLLDWYEHTYSGKETPMKEEDDPILQMRGLGKEIWADTDADEYVRSLRANWYGDQSKER